MFIFQEGPCFSSGKETRVLWAGEKGQIIATGFGQVTFIAVILYTLKPGSHDIISISIRAKQMAKQRNQVKPAT